MFVSPSKYWGYSHINCIAPFCSLLFHNIFLSGTVVIKSFLPHLSNLIHAIGIETDECTECSYSTPHLGTTHSFQTIDSKSLLSYDGGAKRGAKGNERSQKAVLKPRSGANNNIKSTYPQQPIRGQAVLVVSVPLLGTSSSSLVSVINLK